MDAADKKNQAGSDEEARQLIAQQINKAAQAAGVSEEGQRRQADKRGKGDEAHKNGAGECGAPAVRAEPKGVTQKPEREAVPLPPCTAVHVPKLSLPGAEPLPALPGGHEALAEAKQRAVQPGEGRRLRCGHAWCSGSKRASSG